jgi:hypothetical protein
LNACLAAIKSELDRLGWSRSESNPGGFVVTDEVDLGATANGITYSHPGDLRWVHVHNDKVDRYGHAEHILSILKELPEDAKYGLEFISATAPESPASIGKILGFVLAEIRMRSRIKNRPTLDQMLHDCEYKHLISFGLKPGTRAWEVFESSARQAFETSVSQQNEEQRQ